MAQDKSVTVSRTATGLSQSAITAIIEGRIKSGVYTPGSQLPAERDIAAEFNVSRRFVRNAYADLVDRGLIEKSHYRRPFVTFSGNPSQLDQPREPRESMPPQSTQTIAAILPSHPTCPGGLSVVAGIHRVLAEEGSPHRLSFYDTFHTDRAEVLKIEAKAIKAAIDDGIGGLIWWYYCDEDSVLQVVRNHRNIPIVFIDRYPMDIHCDFAGIDDMESSRLAVDYLLDLNHTRIAHLMDPGNFSTILERAQGYRQSHIARGVPVRDDLIVHLDWSRDRMEQAFNHLFSLKEPPTALFATNDFIAYEFLEYAESRGLRVPDDLSIVGHGNIDRYVPRQFLTSVEQPFEMIGKAAAKLMLRRLADKPGPVQTCQQIILQSPLVIRQSARRI
jgi:LacI family transcriptional regulator